MANLDEKKIEMAIESLDINDDKLIFVLLDGEISVKASLFEKHIFFGNLTTSSTKESSCRLNLQLSLLDFFPIYQHITKKKNVENWTQFFDVCQYINEIDLPIQLSKNSELITKWSLTIEDLLTYEKQLFMLKIYTELDKDIDEKTAFTEIFEKYVNDKINLKLNEKSGGKLFPSLRDIKKNSLLFTLESITDKCDKPYHDEFTGKKLYYPLYDKKSKILYKEIPLFKKQLSEEFIGFPWESGYGGHFFMAGGGILKRLVKDTRFYESSDIDFFLVTRNECEAKEMIREFCNWVSKKHREFFITRTNNSVTFVTDKIIYQIILRLYHSKEQVLCGFDIGPCCIGYDGKEVYTIQRGLDSLEKRESLILVWFQSESMSYRTFKYRLRGFNPVFPGLKDEHISTILKNKHKSNTLSRIILSDSKKSTDYDTMTSLNPRTPFVHKRNHIYNVILYRMRHDMDVLSDNIDTIFNTENISSERDIIRHQAHETIHSKIKFLKKMCHGQDSGSFKPTFQNWFEGILW
jgi:hypothetical protein